MVIHHNLIGIIKVLKNLGTASVTKCIVRNDSMAPAYNKGQVVMVDRTKAVVDGNIVAIRNHNGVELREVLFHKGGMYLVAKNRCYAKVALRDYLELEPGAYFIGVVR